MSKVHKEIEVSELLSSFIKNVTIKPTQNGLTMVMTIEKKKVQAYRPQEGLS